MEQNQQGRKAKLDSSPTPYEPPRIEKVLTAGDLEREVQYAGGVTPPSQ